MRYSVCYVCIVYCFSRTATSMLAADVHGSFEIYVYEIRNQDKEAIFSLNSLNSILCLEFSFEKICCH